MSDNARRLAFMAHYNGDVEGRLDEMPVLKALVHCACYVLKLPIVCVIGKKNVLQKIFSSSAAHGWHRV